MFDTKNYNCKCGCGGNNCYMRHCDEYCRLYNVPMSPMAWQIELKAQYNRGYYDAKAEFANEKVRFTSPKEHELFSEKLRKGLKPLEELLKEIEL